MDEAGLYDEKGNRMARPSDAEVARYSNNAYNQAAGPSRREFLRYAGAVAAGGVWTASGKLWENPYRTK